MYNHLICMPCTHIVLVSSGLYSAPLELILDNMHLTLAMYTHLLRLYFLQRIIFSRLLFGVLWHISFLVHKSHLLRDKGGLHDHWLHWEVVELRRLNDPLLLINALHRYVRHWSHVVLCAPVRSRMVAQRLRLHQDWNSGLRSMHLSTSNWYIQTLISSLSSAFMLSLLLLLHNI